MRKKIHLLLPKILLSCWIFSVTLIQIIVFGPNEFIVLLQVYIPNIINNIQIWLLPFLTAAYKG
jgi:hypothetical protein